MFGSVSPQRSASPEIFHKIVSGNAHTLLKILA
jgi:hypothetical protein